MNNTTSFDDLQFYSIEINQILTKHIDNENVILKFNIRYSLPVLIGGKKYPFQEVISSTEDLIQRINDIIEYIDNLMLNSEISDFAFEIKGMQGFLKNLFVEIDAYLKFICLLQAKTYGTKKVSYKLHSSYLDNYYRAQDIRIQSGDTMSEVALALGLGITK
ncbi:hypothetical protein [Paenisporosarcina sp. NPDC076898]|uniref:hypothetical protein n=1 Tax=unclassified Paenisporosarcina TaxID=2642018 RepID=UPI003D07F37D